MHPHTPGLLLAAAAAAVAVGSTRAWDYSHDGNYGAPFPNVTYPGFASENPTTVQGSQSFQDSPPKYPSPCASMLPCSPPPPFLVWCRLCR